MIKVAETFFSIQGEGVSRGLPAVFIRMPHCNLMCEGEDWKCDSLELRNVYNEYTPEALMKKILSFNPKMEQFLEEGRARIIYTGGEPGMIKNAAMIEEFRHSPGFHPYAFNGLEEIETNGSVELNSDYTHILEGIDVVNCSPKLESSGNPLKKRFNRETLDFINKLEHSYFKFVVNNIKDIAEVEDQFSFIDPSKIILMPATHNVHDKLEEDKKWKQFVWELATEKGWMYSGREHIDVFGLRAGV